MKPFRSQSIYISEKCDFYAHILCKAKCAGSDGIMTKDQICDAELIDRWEHLYPELLEIWEKNCEIRQQNKKRYTGLEEEAIRAINESS